MLDVYKRYDFKELYVMCDNEKIGMPCFACRQVISELFKEDCTKNIFPGSNR